MTPRHWRATSRNGTTGTRVKYFLKWKEDEQEDSRFKLDKYLPKMCDKARLIELMHDFVLFDSGIRNYRAYTSTSASRRRSSRIIWHTRAAARASSFTVRLARWILENNPNSRVAIITDRDEWISRSSAYSKRWASRSSAPAAAAIS